MREGHVWQRDAVADATPARLTLAAPSGCRFVHREVRKAAPSQKARDGAAFLAPRVGFEPTTLRLTAGRSTVELPRNDPLVACSF